MHSINHAVSARLGINLATSACKTTVMDCHTVTFLTLPMWLLRVIPSKPVFIEQSIMNIFIHVFGKLVQKKFFSAEKIGKWSVISELVYLIQSYIGSIIMKL